MTQRRNPIASMWTGFWKLVTWLRVAVLNLLFLFILFIVLGAIFSPQQLPLPKEGPLVLAPSGYLVDQKSYKSPTLLLLDSSNEYPAETLVRDLVDTIIAAAHDDNITALILNTNHLMGSSLSKLEEVGQALQVFQKSGKPMIAYGDGYTQAQYYLASYADEIYLNEMGAVLLTGFGLYRHYMEEGLKKLDVNVHVFRVGEYKDFVEPFIRNSMSSASRQQNMRWMNELWGVYTSRIETARQLPPGAVNDLINNLPAHLAKTNGDSAQLALEYGLVDHLISRVAMRNRLIDRFGADAQGNGFKAITQQQYLTQVRLAQQSKPDKVGLIVASGIIRGGEQPAGTIGSATLAQLIRQAREDAAIKALVLRVDSGGGSAFASEIIREELAATRASGKPVIVSMGSVAASGGYWISTPANQIWATPTTITGSIGVFGIFPTFEKTLANMGIHTDGIGTTDLAGATRLDRALPEEAAQVIQASVESVYRHFINLVAEARNMPPEDVHEIAQGRVWTGAAALELGLVDKLGYLRDAIAAAAESADLENYSVKLVTRKLTPTEQFLRAIRGGVQSLTAQIRGVAIAKLLGRTPELKQLHNSISTLTHAKRNTVYAQCLYCGSL